MAETELSLRNRRSGDSRHCKTAESQLLMKNRPRSESIHIYEKAASRNRVVVDKLRHIKDRRLS